MAESEYKKVPAEETAVPEKVEDVQPQYGYGYGVRHVQALLLLFSLCVGYMARAHLGVTIVAMTERHEPACGGTSGTNGTDCGTQPQHANTTETATLFHTYSWPKSTQEIVLGAFFLGYGTMMLPIGLVCQRWGGKIPLQIALFVNGVTSLLTPWLTAWGGWRALSACRLVQGLSQSGYYPGIHTMLAQWVPLSERGSLTSYVYTGTTLGTVAAFQMGGILGASRWGWPSTFWTIGVLCLVMFTFLTIFGAASPTKHKTISEDEKNFILGRVDDGVKRKPLMPWRAVLTSKHVWAIVASHVGTGVSFVFFFTQVPTYMHAILKVDIKNSGLLSSLPYIASSLSVILGGYFSDFFTNRKMVSIKNARIICNSIGSVVPAVAVAAVSYTTSVSLGVTWFVVALTAQGLCHTGWMINYMDLAPNFSGGLMSIGNTATNIFTVIMPILVSSIVTDVNNVSQWRIIMYIMAGMILSTHLVFHLFMTTDTQSWNENENTAVETPNNVKELEVMKTQSSR